MRAKAAHRTILHIYSACISAGLGRSAAQIAHSRSVSGLGSRSARCAPVPSSVPSPPTHWTGGHCVCHALVRSREYNSQLTLSLASSETTLCRTSGRVGRRVPSVGRRPACSYAKLRAKAPPAAWGACGVPVARGGAGWHWRPIRCHRCGDAAPACRLRMQSLTRKGSVGAAVARAIVAGRGVERECGGADGAADVSDAVLPRREVVRGRRHAALCAAARLAARIPAQHRPVTTHAHTECTQN